MLFKMLHTKLVNKLIPYLFWMICIIILTPPLLNSGSYSMDSFWIAEQLTFSFILEKCDCSLYVKLPALLHFGLAVAPETISYSLPFSY